MTADSSRRSFLKRGLAALVGLLAAGRGHASWPHRRPRVGIVGGGLAGVSCAWLLDGVADAVIFESREILGGHAHTIPVGVAHGEIQVDVGAQFFAAGPHPTYTRLLEMVGLLDPDRPDRDVTVEAEMTITLTEAGRDRPRFVSPSTDRAWPILAPWNIAGLLAFFVFAVESRRFCEEGDWFTPLDTWLGELPVSLEERERLLLPLVSAMVGCTIEQARELSARSALAFVACALPDKLLDPFVYNNSLLGLQGNVAHIAGNAGNVTIRSGTPVTAVHPRFGGGFTIRSRDGAAEAVDVVVFATPPYVAGALLSDIPWQRGTARLLERLKFFETEISIHRDPVYMPRLPWHWSAYNPELVGDRCEASVWYGALRPAPEGQAPLSLFKSWATARRRAPRWEIFRRAFLHPLITPDFIRTQRLLAPHQGRGGVWFAGSYTRETDSQETALLSAIEVVERLFPEAPNLLELRARSEAGALRQSPT